MKTAIHLVATVSLISFAFGVAQAADKTVALKVPDTETYVGTQPNGALGIKGKEITTQQIFTLVDVSGGDLDDGDEVRILHQFKGEGAASYWYEKDGEIARTRKESEAGTFKIKKTEAGIAFQAPSGKYVIAPSRSDPLGVTDAADSATVFKVVENPAPTGGAAQEKTE